MFPTFQLEFLLSKMLTQFKPPVLTDERVPPPIACCLLLLNIIYQSVYGFQKFRPHFLSHHSISHTHRVWWWRMVPLLSLVLTRPNKPPGITHTHTHIKARVTTLLSSQDNQKNLTHELLWLRYHYANAWNGYLCASVCVTFFTWPWSSSLGYHQILSSQVQSLHVFDQNTQAATLQDT